MLLCGAVLFSSCGRHKRTAAKSIQELQRDISASEDDRVRVAAIRELGTRQNALVVTTLIVALQDRSVPVRNAAVAALRGFNDPRAKDALWAAMQNPTQSRDFQLAAASALAHLHDARGAGVLVRGLAYAPHRASVSLVELGQAALDPLINALHESEIREAASTILVSIGAAAVDSLIQVLHNDYDKYARLAAAKILGEIDDPRAARALTDLLGAANTEFVAAVYRFLIRRGQPGSEVQLIHTLHTYGSPEMAEDFASSGSPALATAAKDWATESGIPLVGRTSELPLARWASIDQKR